MSEVLESHHLGEDLAAMANDGRGLEPAKLNELTQHLESCTACQAALASARVALSTLTPDELTPSDTFDASLFAKLDAIDLEALASAPTFWSQVIEFFTLPRMGAMATVAAGLAAFIVMRPKEPVEELDETSRELTRIPNDMLDNLETIAIAEELDLLRDLDAIAELDAFEAFDEIESLEVGG